MALLLASEPNEWANVAGAYGVVLAAIVAYATWTIARGRKVGRQVPPERRRWM